MLSQLILLSKTAFFIIIFVCLTFKFITHSLNTWLLPYLLQLIHKAENIFICLCTLFSEQLSCVLMGHFLHFANISIIPYQKLSPIFFFTVVLFLCWVCVLSSRFYEPFARLFSLYFAHHILFTPFSMSTCMYRKQTHLHISSPFG